MSLMLPEADVLFGYPGDAVSLYHRTRPWTSDAVTGYGVDAWPGTPYDAYQPVPGQGGPAVFSPIPGFPAGAFTFLSLSAYRGLAIELGEVWCTFQHKRSGGAFVEDDYHSACVFARASGFSTTVNDGTPDQYSEDISCYVFGLFAGGTGQPKGYALLRVDAGVITLIGGLQLVGPGGGLPPNSSTHQWPPFRLRMVISESPARLTCWSTLYPLPGTGGEPVMPMETLIFDTNDGSGSPDLPTGLWGFGAQNEKLAAPNLVRVEATGFRFRTGALDLVSDDFARRWPESSKLIVSPWGPSGRSLASLYTGDQQGADEGAVRHVMQLEAESSGAQQGGPFVYQNALQEWGWHVSQVPAAFPGAQRLRMTVQSINVDAGTSRAFGVHGHGSFSNVATLKAPSALNKTGYLALVRWNITSSRWDAEIRHFSGSTNTLLATADLGATGLTLASQLVIEFRIANIGASELGLAEGTPAMSMLVSGNLVDNWALQPTILGVVILDEFIYDQRSAATLGGTQNAWYVEAPKTTSSHPGEVNSWETLAPLQPPDPGAIGQATIPVDGETTGAFGELTLPLAWPVELVHGENRVLREVESGVRSTMRRYSSGRRRWRVRSQGRTFDQVLALIDFWEEHGGMSLGFDWTPPEGDAPVAKAHFATKNLPSTLRHLDIAVVEFELEELFDAP